MQGVIADSALGSVRPDRRCAPRTRELITFRDLTLDGGKITQVWTVFGSLALAVQTGAVKAPAWWPGRS